MRQRIQALDDQFAGLSSSVEHSKVIRILAAVTAHSGDSWFWLIGLGLVWWFGNEYWKHLALVMVVSIAVTALIVMIIKFSVRRSRPEGEWGRIYRRTDPHSFPSGHATRSAMLAVVGLGLGPLWLGLTLVVWAPLVGIARIAMGVHYPTDVLAGMLLGIVIGLVILIIV
jgi:undecaprenyl-diphosphatase